MAKQNKELINRLNQMGISKALAAIRAAKKAGKITSEQYMRLGKHILRHVPARPVVSRNEVAEAKQ